MAEGKVHRVVFNFELVAILDDGKGSISRMFVFSGEIFKRMRWPGFELTVLIGFLFRLLCFCFGLVKLLLKPLVPIDLAEVEQPVDDIVKNNAGQRSPVS